MHDSVENQAAVWTALIIARASSWRDGSCLCVRAILQPAGRAASASAGRVAVTERVATIRAMPSSLMSRLMITPPPCTQNVVALPSRPRCGTVADASARCFTISSSLPCDVTSHRLPGTPSARPRPPPPAVMSLWFTVTATRGSVRVWRCRACGPEAGRRIDRRAYRSEGHSQSRTR
jgi:hypothetical protein